MEKLGKLEMGELRECWPHEEKDFTPWLAENIDELARAIGVDTIEVVATEQDVGKYFADIVGRINNGQESIDVVIENQLEKSDHGHLGQIITYASGLNSKCIIWICKEVEDEHRAAIDWLNEHTDEDISFFLIKAELWKIDNSNPALRFDIICSPNNWAKSVKKTSSQFTATQLEQLKFWTKFQNYLEEKTDLKNIFKYKIPKALRESWYTLNFNPGKAFASCIVSFLKDTIRCDLYIETPELYAELFSKRAEINKELGLELEWNESLLEKKQKANGIRYYKKNILLTEEEEENYENCFKWFYEILVKYLTVIPKYLE